MDEIAALVGAVLGAATPTAWHAAVQRFGPRIMDDPAVADMVLARVGALERQGRSGDGQTLRRWYEDVQRRIEQQRAMNQLVAAATDTQVDELLRAQPSVAKAASVEQASPRCAS